MSASNDKRIFQQWTDVMVQFFTSVQVCKFDPNKCISDQIQYSVLTWCKDFVIYSRMWNVKRVWIRIAGDACIAFFVWHVIYIQHDTLTLPTHPFTLDLYILNGFILIWTPVYRSCLEFTWTRNIMDLSNYTLI